MSLEYPFFLLIPILFIVCKILCPAKTEALIFPNASYFDKIKNKISFFEILIITLLSIALASPVKTKILKTNNNLGYDIVTILDTSGSMGEYGKIENAKAIISDFATKRKNDRIGLVVFGNIAYIASPLTFDKKSFNEILKRIYVGIAGGRTAIYDALFLSTTLFKNSHAKNKIAILITDGKDNSSITPLDIALKKLKKAHIKVYTIGLGPDVDAAVLEKIAKSTGGKFFYLTNANELKEVYRQINKLEKSKVASNIIIQKEYYFFYPLIAGIILFIFFLFDYRRKIWNF
ncbi:vWA domain-containing protein [Caminibacter pacificus]|uniref:Ca-activated chloride channel family protein n=1 Tax=Caminibacter pacificus TaxID=1424653 RepID=A0AAJ4RDC7_9BACT|nr:VWA domain-containing protein [Caminibacter pacificus]NPA87834.1 VWA domain-containing protein [Campylobacterota bacterium]QCI28706.1 VWA domain-containing protein [Caminibacter pacificus]ROR40561.1 Ca-activated chloride channel family protein [Caminibacter pacificus]